MKSEERKTFRSQMWLFRRHWKDLNDEQRGLLTRLFDELPALGEVYHRREELSEIFDTAENRAQAAARIDEWCQQATQSDHDWSQFINCFNNHRDGILAYFDERKTSGVVEGLNNKARVVLKRCYGIKSVATFWTRLIVEAGGLLDDCQRTIADLRATAEAIKASLWLVCT